MSHCRNWTEEDCRRFVERIHFPLDAPEIRELLGYLREDERVQMRSAFVQAVTDTIRFVALYYQNEQGALIPLPQGTMAELFFLGYMYSACAKYYARKTSAEAPVDEVLNELNPGSSSIYIGLALKRYREAHDEHMALAAGMLNHAALGPLHARGLPTELIHKFVVGET